MKNDKEEDAFRQADRHLSLFTFDDLLALRFVGRNGGRALPKKGRLEEADVRERFPWDYEILTKRLKDRFSDFKLAKKYHDIRKELEQNPKLCNPRYLDPGNPKSAKKNFYCPNILKDIDKHYKRKK